MKKNLILFCLSLVTPLCWGQAAAPSASYTVYLFPGMGLDHRMFQELHLPYQVRYVDWLPMEKGEDLPHYALRLARQIDTTHSYALVGVSFGGMCVSEIAKVYRPVQAILISSAKSSDEIPFLLKTLRFFPVHKLLPNRVFSSLGYTTRGLFGISTKEEALLFKEMLQSMPRKHFSRTVEAIVTWKNKTPSPSLVHLHGKADFILPFRNIHGAYQIEKGTHLMVFTQPEKLNQLLVELLAQ